MKRFEKTFFPYLKDLFSGFFSSSGGKEEKYLIDFSHMHQGEEGSKMHLFYVLLFAFSLVAVLWQHSLASYTFCMIFLLLPALFFLYIPYRIMDTFWRQVLSCAIFFAACFWISYRVKKNIPFDLALVEGLVCGSFAFLVNCTRKDYHYLFFVSLFLLIYGGLVPRKILLYILPLVFLSIIILLAGERKIFLAGEKKIFRSKAAHSPLRSFFRSWHTGLLQLFVAVPIFIYIFSLIPLHEISEEGFFEVSFMTTRTSALPPDLKKWLNQEKKVQVDGRGNVFVRGNNNADTASRSGKKSNFPDLPGNSDGNGQGSSPGKDLVFTVAMPVKLYHLATLYDEYDGKVWRTSPELLQMQVTDQHSSNKVYSFSINSKYTVFKWLSQNLYAPYRPTDFQQPFPASYTDNMQEWGSFIRLLKQNSFQAKFKEGISLPKLPYSYQVSSVLSIPILGGIENEEKKQDLIDSAGEYFAGQETAKKNKVVEEIRKREEKAKKRKLAKKKILPTFVPKKKTPPVLKKNVTAEKKKSPGRQKALVIAFEKAGGAWKRSKVMGKSEFPCHRPKITGYAPEKLQYIPRMRTSRDAAWRTSLPKKHFLSLPPELSTRVTGLALLLTRDRLTPYEKAMALRNYLRENYKYKLTASPVPEGKESVEYFLFELKEGHCEYFAASLTILARAAGLPARVAIGFSPGNYNALTKFFEVHEYHAHAWSQIYIENVGWLTFDAVPPGNIVSETLPAGLGLLRDPFGEEWKITPPELTQSTLGFVKNTLLKEAVKEKSEELKKTVEKMLENEDELKKKEKGEGKGKKDVVKGKKRKTSSRKPGSAVAERLKNFFLYFTGRTGERIVAFLSTSKGRSFTLVLFIFAGALFLFFRNILSYGKFLFCRYRFGCLITGAEKELSPEKSILILYRALRLLLLLAGMERKHNEELLSYGKNCKKSFYNAFLERKGDHKIRKGSEEKYKEFLMLLEEKSSLFSDDICAVFTFYYSLEYGNRRGSRKEAGELLQKVREIFLLLRELYEDGFFFLEKWIFQEPFPVDEKFSHYSNE